MGEKQEKTRIDLTLLTLQGDDTWKNEGKKQSFFLEDLESMDFRSDDKGFTIRHPIDGWLRIAENPWEVVRNHQS